MAHIRLDPHQEAAWRDAIRRQAQSGLSIREFCRRHRLSEPSFYERRRTYQERDQRRHEPIPAFVPLVVAAERPAGAAVEPGLVLELHGGRCLRLPGSMPVDRIVELVRALEAPEVTA
jgi:transposase-like protein